MTIRILALGDVVGRPGRQVIYQQLPALVRQRQIDLVVCNAENIAGGSGITPKLFHKIRSYGVDVVTLGDHIYRRPDIAMTLQNSERIVKPANLPRQASGRPYTVVTTSGGVAVAVYSVLGRIFVNFPADDPFAASEDVLADIAGRTKIVVCDVHAEATSEKVALGHYMDGRSSLIFGTHTHIPTADAKILPGGTGYITDVGMCGPYDSVLGRRKDRVLRYMTTSMHAPFEVATGDVRMCGVLAEIEVETGKCVAIERLEVHGENADAAYDADDAKSSGGAD
jgi:2',3'-cyclic-nucleotide 2'-phosphodiesterase